MALDLAPDFLAYPMARRGCCLIASMKFGDLPPPFDAKLADQTADYERALLDLGFDKRRITLLENVNSESVTAELNRLAASQDHNQLDCLVVILICQHGYRLHPPPGVAIPGGTPVQATDAGYYRQFPSGGDRGGGTSEDPIRDELRLSEIFSLFRSNNCSSLAGKPKLFFIHSPRELQRLTTRAGIHRHHFSFISGGGDRIKQYVKATRCEEVQLGADFYILYAPLPFLGGQLVPNPPLVLAKAMLQAGRSGERAADLTELVMHLMATVGGSGSAEIAMPKAFSTLTKQVLFSSPGR